MDLEIKGKRALVTGGSKGIGKAVAECLAAEGANIVIAARSAPELEATAATIRSRFGVEVTTIVADLGTSEGLQTVVAGAGEVDILVNNAGAIPPGGLMAVSEEVWRTSWDLKVFGYINLTRAIYPSMAARKSGVVINIIGGAGEKFNPGYIAGTAGNASLMGFSRALGKSSTADGIRVIGLNPGATATERQTMLARSRAKAQLGDEERWQELSKTMPFGRMAKPEEIGWVVAFLASPRAGYVSGTIVTADAGS